MTSATEAKGFLKCGMPYNRLGNGPRPLIVFQGLMFENKPTPPAMVNFYKFLGGDYTVYSVLRKPGLPAGTSLKDMAAANAAMIKEEFGQGPFDIIGVSTGGSIAQVFAADHPGLVRRLVIHSSAYALSEPARAMQRKIAELAAEGRWFEATHLMMGAILPNTGAMKLLAKPLARLMPLVMGEHPKDAGDLVVTIEAEDVFNFKDRLKEIKAPTLLAAGELDPFYTPELFRETAAGIPGARLALYPGIGHPASGRQFERDVLAFLREGS